MRWVERLLDDGDWDTAYLLLAVPSLFVVVFSVGLGLGIPALGGIVGPLWLLLTVRWVRWPAAQTRWGERWVWGALLLPNLALVWVGLSAGGGVRWPAPGQGVGVLGWWVTVPLTLCGAQVCVVWLLRAQRRRVEVEG